MSHYKYPLYGNNILLITQNHFSIAGLKLDCVIWVTFCLSQTGLVWYIKYPVWPGSCHQLTVVMQHPVAVWRPKDVQKHLGPELIIATGAQIIPNFLIITTEWWSKIHRLPTDVWTAAIHCNIDKNYMIFCRHAEYKRFFHYEVFKNEPNMLVMCDYHLCIINDS